jgi:hypothetical protein
MDFALFAAGFATRLLTRASRTRLGLPEERRFVFVID